ncbi:unnamed protein product [Thelazia callipaeda]|uniref:RECA_2 domain-containing protein n=1 Tax=Thelazia callipaeda TaxID=103827 RepID=A0A0N5D251_THECL|nr:unnamed protein product [Thelazia callipaeda]
MEDVEYVEENGLDLFLRLGAPWLVLKTGCQHIDTFLKGGISKGKLTEFVGDVAAGKTQLCLTLTANLLISDRKQEDRVIYIDTNGSFRGTRLKQIMRSRGIQDENEAEKMISKVLVARAYDENDLRLILTKVEEKIWRTEIETNVEQILKQTHLSVVMNKGITRTAAPPLRDHTSQNHFCSVYFVAFRESASECNRDDVAWRRFQSVKQRPTLRLGEMDDEQNFVLLIIDSIGAALAFTAWGYFEGGVSQIILGREIQDEIIARLHQIAHRGIAVMTTNHFVYWRGKQSPALGKKWIRAVDHRYLLCKLPDCGHYIEAINSESRNVRNYLTVISSWRNRYLLA